MLFVDLLIRPGHQGEALREPRFRHHLRISIILLLPQLDFVHLFRKQSTCNKRLNMRGGFLLHSRHSGECDKKISRRNQAITIYTSQREIRRLLGFIPPVQMTI